MESFFNIDFGRALVTTFLGAGLAILLALGLKWLSDNEKRKTETLRRKQLARALEENLKINLKLAKTASTLSPRDYLTENVDLSLLEATRTVKYEILNDIDLGRDIDNFGYHLISLHKIIDLRIEATYSPVTLEAASADLLRDDLNSQILERAAGAIKYAEDHEVIRRLRAMATQT